MYIRDAELAGTTRFFYCIKVYVISGLVISRDNLYEVSQTTLANWYRKPRLLFVPSVPFTLHSSFFIPCTPLK